MKERSFRDFSELKSLKREWDTEERPSPIEAAPPKMQVRKKPRLKSPDELREAQLERETGLKTGRRVALLDSSERGILRHIRKNHVEIELDCGILIPCAYGSFVMLENDGDSKLRKSGSSVTKQKERAHVPEDDFRNRTIDLHIEALPNGKNVPAGQELPFQLDYFKKTLREQLKHRGSRIVFIHGIGDGILKKAIREELDSSFALSCSWNPRDAGETVVTIR